MQRQLAAGHGAAAAGGAGKTGEAFGWGFLSASSLIFGSALGIHRLPSRVVTAALMAFGGGALIEALSIELFAHIIAKARGGGHGGGHGDGDGSVDRGLIFIAVGSALVGGLIFAGLDTILNGRGAFLRKLSTMQAYATSLRSALLQRLIARLKQVPMFEVLETSELTRLAKSMVKERYAAGSTIFQELTGDSSVFFVLSGSVDLTVTTHYARTNSVNRNKVHTNLHSPPLEGDVLLSLGDGDDNKPEDATDEVKDHFRLGPNDIFGEMALFTAETVQAKAVARKPSTLLRIPRAALHTLVASNRRLQDFITMTAIDRLQETEVFCRCTPSTVARLVSFMKQAEFEAGDVLFHDVDSFCPIYFVVLGRIKVLRAGQGGAHHIVSANGLLGTEHLLLGHAANVTATALERSTVLIVQRSNIDKLCERDERFRQALLQSASGAGAGADPVALQPPEGSVAPTRFGVPLRELGWQRQEAPAGADPAKGPHPEEAGAAHAAGAGKGPLEPAGEGDEDVETGVGDLEVSRDILDPGDILTSMEGDLDDLVANQNAAHVAEGKEGHGIAPHDAGHGAQAAIMIWLGILIDAVPESFVMGILVNTASLGTLVAFVVGVFIANFPEAMSSAGIMRLHGMRRPIIMLMWTSIALMTGLGACIGALVFPPGSENDQSVQKAIASIEGLCGGAMLCMIANTVLPEAFEQGGNVTGLSALSGFLLAILVSVSQ